MRRSQAQREVLQVLGMLACAREPLTLQELGQLFGRAAAERMEDLLAVAADFFDGRPAGRAPATPFRFFHTRFQEFILDQVADLQQDLHRQLADACLRWRELDGEARVYALRYLPTHLREARRWDELCEVLTDFDFLQAKIGALPSSSVLTPTNVFDVVKDFSDGLNVLPANYGLRAQVAALSLVVDQNSHFLKEDSSLFVPQVYNALVWDWDEDTILGRQLRDAARRCPRTWLKQLTRPPLTTDPALLRTLTGHTGSVNSVAFSPDGRTLASGGEDGTVRLWDAQTGALRQTFAGHPKEVGSVAFSPDGRTLAGGDWDGTVRLWDAQTGALRQELAGHADWVPFVAFSPDGRTLAGSVNRTVRLWDVQTGVLRQELAGHTGVEFMAFSSDGRTLASGSRHGPVRLWDVQTGALRQELAEHSSSVESVAFSPDGRTLASGSGDRTVRLWNAQTGKLLAWVSCADEVRSLRFYPARPLLAVADAGPATGVPNVSILEIVRRFPTPQS